MSGISYKDLVNDLSKILISYIEPLNLKFFLQDSEVSLKEVFMKSGLMPIFLYDKQPFINFSLRHKKIQHTEDNAFAKLHFQQDNVSFCNIKVDIIHNLYNDDLFKTEDALYQSLLYGLATKILSEKDFEVKGKKVLLDSKVMEFNKAITSEIKEQISDTERVKGA